MALSAAPIPFPVRKTDVRSELAEARMELEARRHEELIFIRRVHSDASRVLRLTPLWRQETSTMDRDRLHKGDRVVVARRPLFAARAVGLIPVGTTGTVLTGGRFNAQVAWDVADRDGNPTTQTGERPYITDQVQREGALS